MHPLRSRILSTWERAIHVPRRLVPATASATASGNSKDLKEGAVHTNYRTRTVDLHSNSNQRFNITLLEFYAVIHTLGRGACDSPKVWRIGSRGSRCRWDYASKWVAATIEVNDNLLHPRISFPSLTQASVVGRLHYHHRQPICYKACLGVAVSRLNVRPYRTISIQMGRQHAWLLTYILRQRGAHNVSICRWPCCRRASSPNSASKDRPRDTSYPYPS